MPTAIGNAPITTLSAGSSATAGLDTQLAKLQTQLADWVNCPSCKTPEGKAKIAEISGQIKAVEQRMQAREQTARPTPSKPDPSSTPPPATGSLGGQVDVFA